MTVAPLARRSASARTASSVRRASTSATSTPVPLSCATACSALGWAAPLSAGAALDDAQRYGLTVRTTSALQQAHILTAIADEHDGRAIGTAFGERTHRLVGAPRIDLGDLHAGTAQLRDGLLGARRERTRHEHHTGIFRLLQRACGAHGQAVALRVVERRARGQRRRPAERRRACDDQHADAHEQGARERRLRTKDEPADEGPQGDQDRDWHPYARHAVHAAADQR